jgi:hypothetical protein
MGRICPCNIEVKERFFGRRNEASGVSSRVAAGEDDEGDGEGAGRLEEP